MAIPVMEKRPNDEVNLAAPMHCQFERLKSYISWPESAKAFPVCLAGAGFYYEGNQAEVVCFSCDGKLDDWEWVDIPLVKHKRNFPRCPFISRQDRTTIHLTTIEPSTNLVVNRTERLNICATVFPNQSFLHDFPSIQLQRNEPEQLNTPNLVVISDNVNDNLIFPAVPLIDDFQEQGRSEQER